MSYDMKSFKFGKGCHTTREQGMCLMEAVAYIAGEEHSDHPKCASPVITEIAINLNDNARDDEERQRILSPILWRIPGTKNNSLERERIQLYRNFINELLEKDLLIPESILDIYCSKGIKTKEKYDYLFEEQIELDDKNLFFLKDQWENVLQPLFLEMIDKLINMTEIKEIVPSINSTSTEASCGK